MRRKETSEVRLGTLFDPTYIDLVTGQSLRIELSSFQDVSGLIISVQQGQLNIWFGDYGGLQLPLVAQFHFYPTGQTQHIDVPRGTPVLTVAAAGAISPLRACIILVN